MNEFCFLVSMPNINLSPPPPSMDQYIHFLLNQEIFNPIELAGLTVGMLEPKEHCDSGKPTNLS